MYPFVSFRNDSLLEFLIAVGENERNRTAS